MFLLVHVWQRNKIHFKVKIHSSFTHTQIFYNFFPLLRYSDITEISRSGNSIYVKTLNNLDYTFGLLFSVNETYMLIEQLSKMAMQNLIKDPESPTYDHNPTMFRKLSKNVTSKSYLLRDLTTRQHSEEYRRVFRLPATEILDGKIKANLWLPYKKRYANGSIFLSQNFMCFSSDVRGLVYLVIPLKMIQVNDFDGKKNFCQADSCVKFDNFHRVLKRKTMNRLHVLKIR